ncbi:MAG TPA: hypothetical protein VF240_08605 [Pyrinomonadaceae bacterium]
MKSAKIFFLLVLFAACPRAQETGARATGPVSAAEAARWREDIRYMAEEMPRYHANLFHTLSREQFEAAVRGLHERVPQLARHQIIVEMMRVVASVGDGHTNIAPTRDPKVGFRALPVKLYLFKDGLFVRAATHEHAGLVGARVLKIGGVSADEAIARAREIIGRDNEMGVRFFAPFLLAMPEVLHALGLADDAEGARFVVEAELRQQSVTLRPAGPVEMLPADTDTSWLPKDGWVDMRDGAKAAPPLWLKEAREEFWFEHLKETRTLYVQLNKVGDKKGESLADFTKRLFAFVEANEVERFVLDLRLNRGGNGELLTPLVRSIIKSKIDRPGKFFVITGRGTWSASQFLIDHLEKYTDAVFVGEPSGSKGNHYGDSRRITLPNSGLTVRVSIYYWQHWHPIDTRPWSAPEVTAELSSEDYRAGVDPALRAVLGYVPRRNLTEILDEALTAGGAELAVKRFREFKAEPANKYADTEESLLIAGFRLLQENKPEQALALFKLCAEENPHSFRAHFAVGEAHLRGANKALAAESFEKALRINPKYYEAAERLKQLRRK